MGVRFCAIAVPSNWVSEPLLNLSLDYCPRVIHSKPYQTSPAKWKLCRMWSIGCYGDVFVNMAYSDYAYSGMVRYPVSQLPDQFKPDVIVAPGCSYERTLYDAQTFSAILGAFKEKYRDKSIIMAVCHVEEK